MALSINLASCFSGSQGGLNTINSLWFSYLPNRWPQSSSIFRDSLVSAMHSFIPVIAFGFTSVAYTFWKLYSSIEESAHRFLHQYPWPIFLLHCNVLTNYRIGLNVQIGSENRCHNTDEFYCATRVWKPLFHTIAMNYSVPVFAESLCRNDYFLGIIFLTNQCLELFSPKAFD